MIFLNTRTNGTAYRSQVFTLYHQSFPEIEKKPDDTLEFLENQGKIEILALVDEEEFIGMAIHMITDHMALLDYFAISPQKQGQGYGSRAICSLLERFRNKQYIIEIEIQNAESEDAEIRKRRKAFYLRNGLKETGIFVNVYYTDLELLTPNGNLTYEEYVGMLTAILGKKGVHMLSPRLI